MLSIMNDAVFINKGYQISTDKNLLDFEVIHKYLNEDSYWANGMPVDVLKTAIENSVCFGVFYLQQQIGFASVITDKATFAYIGNVFVLPEFRGKGLSKWLMQTIMAHPELQGLRRWSLATADAHGLYKQFGFKEISHPDRWMEIYTPGIYKGN
jgi:GNAT superfamily N-acetyltransferase